MIGGFVGEIRNADEMGINVTMTNLINNGTINGDQITGGLVGYIDKNKVIEMTMSNCSNNGDTISSITSGSKNGGIVGSIYYNEDMRMIIHNYFNNGKVTSQYIKVGGFIGEIQQNT